MFESKALGAAVLFAIIALICVAIERVELKWFPRARKRKYPLYRHVKSGREYAVLNYGKFESNGKRCVIYAPVDSLKNPEPWVRDYDEFFDGRFIKLSDSQ